MQEDLLGYLLGALEPDEIRRVEQWLREDADARRELIELERVLKRLEDADELDGDALDEELAGLIDPVPPVDLVARTLASLPPLPVQPQDLGDPAAIGAEMRFQGAGTAHPDANNIFGNLRLSRNDEDGASETWNLRDWGVSITAAIILIAIAMPTLFEGRFAARKAACQNNLRELGVAMTQFAGRNAQSRLPAVAPDGYQSFAGIYTLWLDEAGLLDGPHQTLCPSIGPQGLTEQAWMPGLSGQGLSGQGLSRTPQTQPVFVTMKTLDEIGQELADARNVPFGDPEARRRVMQAIEILRRIQMNVGGHYAYNLGVCDEGQFSSPRFEGRSGFAVMSDAAFTRVKASNPVTTRQAAYRFNVSSHGGRGINVLYEDGHVGFLPSESLDRIPDNPLINHDGLLEAGVTLDDSSLGLSWQAPFTHAIQR